jgi:hypothetical protein
MRIPGIRPQVRIGTAGSCGGFPTSADFLRAAALVGRPSSQLPLYGRPRRSPAVSWHLWGSNPAASRTEAFADAPRAPRLARRLQPLLATSRGPPMQHGASVFAGPASSQLGAAVCDALQQSPGLYACRRFPDGETQIEVRQSVRGHDVYLLQSTSPPVDRHLMELLLLADACRRAGAFASDRPYSVLRVCAAGPAIGSPIARAGRREGPRHGRIRPVAADRRPFPGDRSGLDVLGRHGGGVGHTTPLATVAERSCDPCRAALAFTWIASLLPEIQRLEWQGQHDHRALFVADTRNGLQETKLHG